MRFHIPGLPHTQMNNRFSCCAFTMNAMLLGRMLSKAGHTVYQYAADGSDDIGTEFVSVMDEDEFAQGQKPDRLIRYQDGYDQRAHLIRSRTLQAMQSRVQPGDFICAYMGRETRYDIPGALTVETGVGYTHTFSTYRVFPSYAWMHYHHGREHEIYHPRKWHEAVIPHAYDPGLFRPRCHDEAYHASLDGTRPLLFLGRCIVEKGLEIAVRIAKQLNRDLIVAGPIVQCDGRTDPQVLQWINSYPKTTYVGEINQEQRAVLLRDAEVLLCPSLYDEPFGLVMVESLASGTPVIATDWGGATEIVQHGTNGFRCRTFSEFVHAVERLPELDRMEIEEDAFARYSIDNVAKQYVEYFNRLHHEIAKSDWWQLLPNSS